MRFTANNLNAASLTKVYYIAGDAGSSVPFSILEVTYRANQE